MPEERELFIDSCIQCPHLWTNRIIVLASFYMIKKGDAQLAFSIIVRFMSHPHDLMHKACGWMLREVGKRVNETILCEFLDTHKQNMPRTMLRYAIERLDPEKKTFYMQR
jgi:3-methyladenine DNA glycosylase AlkD